MLLQTCLFLTLILSGIVLVVLILLRDGQRGPQGISRETLGRASVATGAIFLGSAAWILASTDEHTGSLLAGRRLDGDASPNAVMAAPASGLGATPVDDSESGVDEGAAPADE